MEAGHPLTQLPDSRPAHERISAARRWSMLAVGTFAQASAAAVYHGPAFLIPALTRHEGMTLTQAGVVAAAPLAGVMCSLVLWGFVVDHRGERFGLLAGLGGAALAAIVATQVSGAVALSVALFAAGACGAATNSASARVVVGWFPPERRGLAMGIRQMAQPLGVAASAATIAPIAMGAGVAPAIWVPAAGLTIAVVLVAVVVIDPPRPPSRAGSARNPYRGSRFLIRIHGTSSLLVVPQFLVWTYSLTWLVDDLGWSAAIAGAVVAVTQLIGSFARVAAGWLSDWVGSRMKPLRWIACVASATMLLLGIFAGLDGTWAAAIAVVMMFVASAVTVADNGLAFTAVAERAGPFWSGRALGVQNTAQFLTAAIVPPLAGAAITHWDYGLVFGIAAVMPLVAIPLVPVDDERAIGD